jgi:hypothetical protein
VPTPVPTAPPPPPPPSTWIGAAQTDDNGATLTLVSVEQLTAHDAYTIPDAGKHYASIQVQECAGGHTLDANAADWHALLPDTTSLDESGGFREPHLTLTTLNPGRCERGWVTFQVPNGVQITGVHYDGDGASLDWDA